MVPVCLYFQLHQPWRLKPYNYFQVGRDHRYFDEARNAALLRRVAEKCYLPATAMLQDLLRAHPGFSAAFSISGTLLQQLRAFSPDVLESFRGLVATGRVELLAETSHHSLAFLASPAEFAEQVALHRRLVAEELESEPRVFRNTELIYSDGLAEAAEEMGFAGVLADGVEELLGGRSPHHVYRAATPGGLPLLLRDYRLSDDIAFRFSNRAWSEYPLTPARYARWVAGVPGELLCLFMDFETFGEHHAKETGIFEFFRGWVAAHLAMSGAEFLTPSEALRRLPARDVLSAGRTFSWADEARDVSAWQGNDIQRDALRSLYALEPKVRAAGSPDLLEDFRRLSTSDHFYYMATKAAADGDVHAYFSPYESPYDAYMTYMHVLADLHRRAEPARRPASASPRPPTLRPLG
jgi:alpha-amylase